MTRYLSLLLLLSLTGIVHAAQQVIVAREVEVRSGPSTAYYVTGQLHSGDRVDVQETSNGYLKIVPPAGSFSLIRKQDVQETQPGSGVVVNDNSQTRIGSLMATPDTRGTLLPKNTPVKILGEDSRTTGQGTIAYYKIEPVNEYRFIHASAIQKSDIIQASGTGPGLSTPDQGAPKVSPEVAAKMQVAEQAYRKAQATKAQADWNEALRLWKELEQCGEHDAGMAAYNRRYFIEEEMNGGRQPAAASPVSRAGFRDNFTPGAPARGGAQSMQPRSSYTYATEGSPSSPSRISPIPQSPTPPAAPAARPPVDKNASQAKYNPPPASPASGNTLMPGRLVRSSKTDINGKPLYVLLDSQNQIKCYVAPAAGQSLERFVEQNVQVQGNGLVYQAFLRNNLLVAADVRPLN